MWNDFRTYSLDLLHWVFLEKNCLNSLVHYFHHFFSLFFILSPHSTFISYTALQIWHCKTRNHLLVFLGHFARRMLLTFPDSQDSQCFLFHIHLIPGRAFLHSSSSLNASQFGGLYTRMSFKRTLEKPPNMYIDLLGKKQVNITYSSYK